MLTAKAMSAKVHQDRYSTTWDSSVAFSNFESTDTAFSSQTQTSSKYFGYKLVDQPKFFLNQGSAGHWHPENSEVCQYPSLQILPSNNVISAVFFRDLRQLWFCPQLSSLVVKLSITILL